MIRIYNKFLAYFILLLEQFKKFMKMKQKLFIFDISSDELIRKLTYFNILK
jgi:hypothetical protein